VEEEAKDGTEYYHEQGQGGEGGEVFLIFFCKSSSVNPARSSFLVL